MGFNDLSQVQVNNAKTIIRVGYQMGMSRRDIQIALMTALQESSLINNPGGLGDSAGLFQQIPSWGPYAKRTNPEAATRMFFQALRNVQGRDHLKMWEAAQAVQRSANGFLYKSEHDLALDTWKHLHANPQGPSGHTGFGAGLLGGSPEDPMHGSASHSQSTSLPFGQDVAGDLTTPTPTMDLAPDVASASATEAPSSPTADFSLNPRTFEARGVNDPAAISSRGLARMASGGAPTPPESFGVPGQGGAGGGGFGGANWRHRIVEMAHKALGIPYVWGGEGPGGVDCSGLVQWLYGRLGIDFPRVSADQANVGFGHRRNISKLQPGDLVFWNNSTRNNGADHVAIYIGHGRIIEAPRPGLSVQVSSLYDLGEAWGLHLRPKGL